MYVLLIAQKAVREGLRFLANSSAKIQQNPQIAKLFFLSRKEFKSVTFCFSTNAAKRLKSYPTRLLQIFNYVIFSIFMSLITNPISLHTIS